jgi:hypothetical protein
VSTFDTVRFSLDGSGHWTDSHDLPEGWSNTDALFIEGNEVRRSRIRQHDATGLRIGGPPEGALWVEASLPRLVHPVNGILLKPDELPSAVASLKALVKQAAETSTLGDLTRCDLALNFLIEPSLAIRSLRGISHPRIRRAGKEFFDSGLDWPGHKVHARLYDKGLEQNGVRGGPMRLEFQLRGKSALPAVWNGTSLDASIAHQSYRRLALGFQPRPLAAPTSVIEFLAWLHESGVEIDGVRPLEVFIAMKACPRYRRRLRAKVLRAKAGQFVLDLDSLLPVEGFPDFHDCLPVSTTALAMAA